MYLLYRAALAFHDLGRHDSRERQDQLFCTLDREYAARDVVQIQFVRRVVYGAKQVANIAVTGRLSKQFLATILTRKNPGFGRAKRRLTDH